MQPLEKQLRSKLENTVKDARDIAEAGALAALQQLGVGLKEADAHLSEAEKDLRRRLRAHGRQLGDLRKPDGTQELARLTEEVAYEHWHRMLFARFLAENDLLMYPDPDEPVAVSLEECEEMASDEGARNGWELAAQYASRMLPQIFRPDSPSFELELPPEYQRKLENLLAGLAVEVFQASDALGWVYQFWQAKRKDEVNASEVKIGARELPAVTQLFTEPYMVSFLLDNSLGAWWAARRLSESDLKAAQTEEELRQKASLPGVPLEYLRFVKDEESGAWTPAAGTFDGWPEQLTELKTLDPCCGSGHFLVAAFLMLVPMRMEREGLSAREAVDAVLRENLHGLEIDPRCVEIAAFALALTAWRYPEAGGYRPLPDLQVACSGLSISVAKEEWKQLAELAADAFEGKLQADLFGDEQSGLWKTRLTGAMDRLYLLFGNAPILGSLIEPRMIGRELFHADFEESGSLFEELTNVARTAEHKEMGVVAQGLSKATQILANTFFWIFTNPPYLTIKRQDGALKEYCSERFPTAKHDIAAVFLLRLKRLLRNAGQLSLVLPQNWTFQPSYKKFRKDLFEESSISHIARLGAGAFETISGEIVKVVLLQLSMKSGWEKRGFVAIDVSSISGAQSKAEALIRNECLNICTSTIKADPDTRVLFSNDFSRVNLLSESSISMRGIVSGDNDKWCRKYYEISDLNRWRFYQGTPENTSLFTGKTNVIDWSTDGNGMLRPGAKNKAYESMGVAVGQIGKLPGTLYLGDLYDNSTGVIIPNDQSDLSALWSYIESDEFNLRVRDVDQALKVTNATLVKVPFDLEHWTKVAEKKYPNGLPKPYSDDPTQWIFHGHPVGSDDPLQVAVGRLLGYQWPAELDDEMELSDEARDKVAQSQKLLPFADEDGIVCIPPVRGEASAADRLLNLLASAYGDTWSNATLGKLLTEAEQKDKSLEGWLRDRFFVQHCKRFQHRPFIWHIWDGLRDGFAALVNYHKFDAKALETLIYTYLGDWISRQQQDIRNNVDGAQEKLAAAENLKQRLEAIREGEPPYDIFVRWKPLDSQPIGWNPDLNDGVRLNIRPFMAGPDLKKKGAGILREKPNIHWKKDRGKDVESAPWFHLFQGERVNDHHITREEKEAARKEEEK